MYPLSLNTQVQISRIPFNPNGSSTVSMVGIGNRARQNSADVAGSPNTGEGKGPSPGLAQYLAPHSQLLVFNSPPPPPPPRPSKYNREQKFLSHGRQPEVECFLLWRGFAPFHGQENSCFYVTNAMASKRSKE